MQADLVLVVDYGAQYAQLIARRVREAHVYSEIVSHTTPVAELLARRPKAIILSGGPASVYADGAPQTDPALFTAGVPVFGICYGFQAMAQALGGEVAHTGGFGVRAGRAGGVRARRAAARLPPSQQVWMSHGDAVTPPPPGLHRDRVDGGRAGRGVRGRRARAGRRAVPPRGAAHRARPGDPAALPVRHRRRRPSWTEANIIDEQVAAIRAQVGGKRVMCGLSGGVDSAVAAALVQRAVGDQLTCVFVDHGLLRAGEAEQVERDFVAATGVRLKVVDAADQFLDALAGVSDPEEKRKIIGREFIRVFEAAAREVVADAGARRERRLPRAGHALPRRRRVRRRLRHREHQEPPQRRRAARRPAVRAGRAAALAVQGRGAPRRRATRAARPRSSGASRSPGRAWASGSSAR